MWWQRLYDVFYRLLRLPSFVRDWGYRERESSGLSVEQQAQVKVIESTFQSLPVELRLHIFSCLELRPYIVAHGVCSEWRHLLPFADIHPVRRRLFLFYHHMINTTGLPNTRGWTVDNLALFNR